MHFSLERLRCRAWRSIACEVRGKAGGFGCCYSLPYVDRIWGLGFRDLGFRVDSLPYVDRMWGIWGSYYDIPNAIFHLPKGNYTCFGVPCSVGMLLWFGIVCRISVWDSVGY